MRLGGIGASAGVAVAVAVAVAACRQLVGIGDDPPQGPPTEAGAEGEAGVCGLPIAGPCATCIGASCCGLASTCSASPSCAHSITCLADCDADPTCNATCFRRYGASAAGDGTAELFACAASSCADECLGSTCGGLDVVFASSPDAAVACADCVSLIPGGCTDEKSCATSAACMEVGLCAEACQGRIVCANGCLTPIDAGAVSTFYAWYEQGASTCRSTCVGAGDWACLGALTTPPAQAPSTVLNVSFFDEMNEPVPGVVVQLCAPTTGVCAPAAATSDGSGNAKVTVQLPTTAVQGGSALVGPKGFLRLSSAADAGLATQLFYWGDPLDQATSRVSVQILSLLDEEAGAGSLGVDIDPQLGIVVATAFDCRAVAAQGVQMTLETPDGPGPRAYYESDGTLNAGNTATDRAGVALFVNVPVGIAQIAATPVTLAPTVTNRASVLVQPNTVTLVYMPPTG